MNVTPPTNQQIDALLHERNAFEQAFLSANGFHTKAELALEWEKGLSGVMFRAGCTGQVTLAAPQPSISDGLICAIWKCAPTTHWDREQCLQKARELFAAPQPEAHETAQPVAATVTEGWMRTAFTRADHEAPFVGLSPWQIWRRACLLTSLAISAQPEAKAQAVPARVLERIAEYVENIEGDGLDASSVRGLLLALNAENDAAPQPPAPSDPDVDGLRELVKQRDATIVDLIQQRDQHHAECLRLCGVVETPSPSEQQGPNCGWCMGTGVDGDVGPHGEAVSFDCKCVKKDRQAPAPQPKAIQLISVEESLPPNEDPVLVYIEASDDGLPYFSVDSFVMGREDPYDEEGPTIETGRTWSDHGHSEVSHWMPLPKPPGAEQ